MRRVVDRDVRSAIGSQKVEQIYLILYDMKRGQWMVICRCNYTKALMFLWQGFRARKRLITWFTYHRFHEESACTILAGVINRKASPQLVYDISYDRYDMIPVPTNLPPIKGREVYLFSVKVPFQNGFIFVLE